MLSGLLAFELFNCANRCSLEELIPGAILVAFVVFLSSFAGAKKFAMQAMGGVWSRFNLLNPFWSHLTFV